MYKLTLLLCAFAMATQAQTATLTGQIKNAKVDSVYVTHYDMLQNDEVREGAALNAAGKFKLHFIPKAHTKYQFECNGEVTSIHLEAGDSLHLTLNVKQFDESLVYSGTPAPFNNYLAAHYLKFEDDADDEVNLQIAYQIKIQKLDPWPYMAWVDSVTEAQLSFLANWKDQLPAHLYERESGRITFEGYNQKSLYRALRAFFAQQSDKIKEPEYPSNLDDFFLEVPLDRDALVFDDNYLTVAFWKLLRVMRDVFPEISSESPQFSLKYLHLVDSLCTPTVAHQLGKYWLTKGLERSGTELHVAAVQQYLNSDAPADLKKELEQLYQKTHAFATGAPAFAFELVDLKGQTVTLSSLKGKFVYLDFWAAWCAPCVAELQYVRKNNFKAPDSSFVFVYISLDEAEETWRKSSAKYLPEGNHLWGKGLNTEVAKAYGINGLPSYFLIGPDGSFLSTHPPRPSSGQLHQYLLDEKAKFEAK